MRIVLAVFLAALGVVASLAAARARFRRRVEAEIGTLLGKASSRSGASVERSELEALPALVRRWLEASGVVGRERIRTIRLEQRGELRTSPDGAWMPAQAEQYFSLDPPAFVWWVDATIMGVLPVSGRDKYADGHGHMLIKAAAIFNLVDAADEKIDQGSMLRFLAEMIWFPSAALSPYLAWEAVDAESAKVTMRHGGLVASAVFTFSEQGRVTGVRAMRYRGGGANAQLTPWVASCSEWRTFQDVEVPTRGQVGWELASGEFVYYRWEILDLEFNRAELRRADPRLRQLTRESAAQALKTRR